jgi:hypothetical protein
MIDSTQILIIIVVVVLTILLSAIGIQVFFILREVQRSIQKVNKILDDTGLVSESVAKPIASLSNHLTSFSGIAGLFGWLAKKRHEKKAGGSNE